MGWNIGSVLTKVGGSLLKNAFPPLSGMAFDAVNAVLPEDKKLSDNSTGHDAQKAIDTGLSPQARQSLMEKELEVEITEIKEWSNVIDSLAQADASGSSTRPVIAGRMAWLVCITDSVFIFALCYAIFTDKVNMVGELKEAWPLILAVLGTPTALLRSYFGMRTKEKRARYDMTAGTQQSKGGWLTEIISAFRK